MLTPGSTFDHAIVPVFPTLTDNSKPDTSTGVFALTSTEFTAVVIVVRPVRDAVTSIDTSTAWSDIVNKLVLTRVECDIDGDVFYPEIDLSNWEKISTESFKQDSENEYDFKVESYIKINNS